MGCSKLTIKILTMVHNKAAWIPQVRGQLEVGDGPEPQVGEFEVLIENKAVAINPGMMTS